MAGSSVAAECAADARVVLLEMESSPGQHATGRSAAFFSPAYGSGIVRAFTAASEALFRSPPVDFSDLPLLRPRDCLFIGRPDQRASLTDLAAEVTFLEMLDAVEARHRVSALRPGYVDGALCDASGGDLDVDALHQAYLRLLRQRGGELQVDNRVRSIERSGGHWRVKTERGEYRAPQVVNAAGAWADEVASLAGLGALGIEPRRRSVLLVDAPEQYETARWPLLVDVDEAFYCKPEAGQLLLSPADETPSPPCDAQPEEIDLAVAVDRVTRALDLDIRRINHRWAGLRSFAPDNTFVLGDDPRAEGFFWLAGQGGYGIQSAPALAQLAAHLLIGRTLPIQCAKLKEHLGAIAPARLITE